MEKPPIDPSVGDTDNIPSWSASSLNTGHNTDKNDNRLAPIGS